MYLVNVMRTFFIYMSTNWQNIQQSWPDHVRGAIKKFSAWPSSVQNKIKILFPSYSSKT